MILSYYWKPILAKAMREKLRNYIPVEIAIQRLRNLSIERVANKYGGQISVSPDGTQYWIYVRPDYSAHLERITIYHEFAHWLAIQFFDCADHGPHWQRLIRALGYKGEALIYADEPALPKAARK